MLTRHAKFLFSAALVASLIVHASLLALVSRSIARSQRQAHEENADQVVMLLPPEPPQEVALGIDAPTPPSETWLGSEVAQPHVAAVGAVEQAAFTQEPIAPTPSPDNIIEPAQDRAVEPEPSTEVLAHMPPKVQPSKPQERPADEPELSTASAHTPHTILSDWLATIGLESVLEKREPVTPADQPSKPAPKSPAIPQPHVATNSAQSSPIQAMASLATTGKPNDGEVSDKDSTAASIIDVPRDQWQKGKPIAAHGLELMPQRPEFTVLTMLTSAPGNPLCLIKFGSDGVPVKAELVEGSGDPRIDEALRASLYRWRASGKELQRLAKDQTADVTMRIILTRARRS